MSKNIILQIKEINDKNIDNEIYPQFFPEYFFLKEQSKKNIINQRQTQTQRETKNNRVKTNLSNNMFFFNRKF